MHPNNIPPDSQTEKLPSEIFNVPSLADNEQETKDESQKRNIVDQLLELCEPCEFWSDLSGVPYATVQSGKHREHYRVESSFFERWVRHQYFETTGKGVSTEQLKQALSTLCARATFNGVIHEAPLRVARTSDEHCWLDLCDEEWRTVEIDSNGWRVVKNPSVRFVRQPGMEALPVPQKGNLAALWPLVHCAPEDRIILVGFLLNALHPTGPYLGLNLFGSKGSAKSTSTRILRSLIDPNEAFSQSMPRTAEDMTLSARSQRVLALENLSQIPDAESDWLCRLSTGDAIRRRTLYANAEETIFRVKRPWMINGIANVVSRGDLIDRALSVELLPIARSERREEGEVLAELERAVPAILGALLDGVGHALATIDEIRPAFKGQLPRMADVALWITAAEPALGFTQGSFLKRHAELAAESSADAAEGSGVAATIKRLADENEEWKGLMKGLLKEIELDHPNDRYLPQTPRALGNAINRLKTDLWEAHSIRVEKLPRQAAGVSVRIWTEVQNIHHLHTPLPDRGQTSEGQEKQPLKVHSQVHSESAAPKRESV